MQVQSLGREDSLKEEMATHFSILAWRIPWTEGPGGLQSMWVTRVGHDCARMRVCTRAHTHTHTHRVTDKFRMVICGHFS